MRLALCLFLPAAAWGQDSPQILRNISAGRILEAILVVLVVYGLVRLSNAALEALARQVPRSRFFFKAAAPVARFGLWLGGGLLILTAIFAPTQQTLWAVLTAIGVALGFGAQDLVKNLIGGLVVLTDRPYQLGDRVKIGAAYGEIDHIGLRSTKLTTADDTRVTIPNSEILTGMAWNANSGALDCQVVTELYLPPDSDPAAAVEVGYEAAYTSPYVLLAKPVVVRLEDGFQQAPYLMLKVKAYVYDHRYEPALKSDITLRAKTEFLRRGMLAGWPRAGAASGSERL
jgi:small-conductance mechanosensitive channel